MDPGLSAVIEADNTEQALSNALDSATGLAPAERFVVKNQLRLRLAAVQIQQGHFDKARDMLRQIDTESPAALQASLLMAESYRLTAQPTEARKWFLRTAKHYPYRPMTLNGLISAAHDEQPRNPALSAALYHEVSAQSHFALAQLDAFENNGDLDPMAIIFPSSLDDAVRKTLLRRSLHHPEHNLLAETGQLKSSVTAILALRERHAAVDQELNQLGIKLANYQRQRDSLEKQLIAGDQELQALKAQMIPRDFGAEQTRIRQGITLRRNQQTRLRAQLAFIEQAQQALPDIARKLEQQLQALHHSAQKQLGSSHSAVTEVLEDTLKQYRVELSNLAAEAQLQRSELMLSSP